MYSGYETKVSSAVFTCTYTGYNLAFETNGGTEIDSVAVIGNTEISLSDYTTTRSGYTFSGWYADSSFQTKVTEITLTADTMIYAGWKLNEENVSEEPAKYYLALGGDTTSGYGLDDADTEGCVSQFGTLINAGTVVNAGADGQTSAELLALLESGAYDNEIANAGVITITAGGNDLSLACCAVIAELYNETYPTRTPLSAEDVQTILAAGAVSSSAGTVNSASEAQTLLTGALSITSEAQTLLTGALSITSEAQTLRDDTVSSVSDTPAVLADSNVTLGVAYDLYVLINSTDQSAALAGSATFQTAVSSYVSNINSIAAYIQQKNPYAVILVANQFNPYQWLGASASNITNLIGTGVTAFNTALSTSAATSYTIADIATAFSASSVALSNAKADMSNMIFVSSFQPNAAGHQVIANVLKAAYDTVTYTWKIPVALTVTADGSVEAPEQTFELELLDLNGTALDEIADISVTVATDSVDSDGSGTYTAVLTFTGNNYLLDELKNGFYVRITSGSEAGWTYDDTMYLVNNFTWSSTGELTGYSITLSDGTSGGTSVTEAAFACSYTGWSLSFETNGGSAISSVSAANGTTISLADYTPTRSGYTFTGWYSDKSLTTEVETVSLTADTTVYAGWKADSAAADTGNDGSNQTSSANGSDQTGKTAGADTGDNSLIEFWIVLALVCGLGAAIILLYNRKRILK